MWNDSSCFVLFSVNINSVSDVWKKEMQSNIKHSHTTLNIDSLVTSFTLKL